MASTASTVLRQELMTASENDGTWGPKTNVNLQILEAAAGCGETEISTTSGTVTLTNVDYTNDQAKKRVLRCTGTLVGNLILVVPNAKKTYLLINATAGAFTVSIKTSSGTAKTVTQTTSAELYCDGSDNVTFVTPQCNPTTGAPADASGAAASSVSVTPTGNLAATNGQAAFAELQTDIDNRQPLDSDLTAIAAVTPTKGTTYAGNGSAPAGLTVGSDYTSVIADASQTTGLRYAFVQPIGVVLPYAGAAAPTGWLLCYGQAVSRSTYAALFAVCSTTYGVGDGSTTFNLPDLRGRVPAGQDDMGGTSANRLTNPGTTVGGIDGDVLGGTGGSETHQLTEAQLAAHDHAVTGGTFGGVAGFSASGGGQVVPAGAAAIDISDAGGDVAHNNVQPTIILNYIIWAAA
jgi:microcystin-dependent protein